MSNEKVKKSRKRTMGAVEEETSEADVQADIAKARDAVGTAIASMTVGAKEVMSEAQAKAREAVTAVRAKMQAVTSEMKEAASGVQARAVKAGKAMKAESNVAKMEMRRLQQTAAGEARGVLVGAKAGVDKVRKAVRGAVLGVAGKKAKAGTASRKAVTPVKISAHHLAVTSNMMGRSGHMVA